MCENSMSTSDVNKFCGQIRCMVTITTRLAIEMFSFPLILAHAHAFVSIFIRLFIPYYIFAVNSQIHIYLFSISKNVSIR